MSTGLAAADKLDFNLPVEQLTKLMEQLQGLGAPSMDVVKMPAAGSTVFEVDDIDPEQPEIMSYLEGVIMYHHPVNAYWKGTYSGQNDKPDCASYDGITGKDQSDNEYKCAACKYNEYGSGSDGKGKACKNMHRLYILRDGVIIPLRLTLPPTSLGNLKKYIQFMCTRKGLVPEEMITRITLRKAISDGGISYSKAEFAYKGTLSEEAQKVIQDYAESIKLNAPKEISADEYDTQFGDSVSGHGNTEPAAKSNTEPVGEEYSGDIPQEFTGDLPL